MGLLGISLLVASVVYAILHPPPWLWSWRVFPPAIADGTDAAARSQPLEKRREEPDAAQGDAVSTIRARPEHGRSPGAAAMASPPASDRIDHNQAAMPPPRPPPIQLPPIQPPTVEAPDSPATPKASALPSTQPVPGFLLSGSPSSSSAPGSLMPPPPPPPRPPPPLPPSPPRSSRIPSLNQFPAANSTQRARGRPAPDRAPPPPPLSSGLAPPPTRSSKPSKPSRKVILAPGRSPLDWARISGPNADLRGLPPSTPYLRVTPSMLKAQTGRRGRDAWMALNGKVYNITPYATFHPGGLPELLRGAARDGTKLFGEVHPWVNYETMLAACLVGLLVDEPGAGQETEMDAMD